MSEHHYKIWYPGYCSLIFFPLRIYWTNSITRQRKYESYVRSKNKRFYNRVESNGSNEQWNTLTIGLIFRSSLIGCPLMRHNKTIIGKLNSNCIVPYNSNCSDNNGNKDNSELIERILHYQFTSYLWLCRILIYVSSIEPLYFFYRKICIF